MYATSKLIIPAKSAQDSPYVPKIRIFLRPSSSLDKSSDMRTSLSPDSLVTDVSKQKYNEDSVTEYGDNRKDTSSLTATPSQTDGVSNLLQDQVRGGRKRKVVGSLDNIDFERRDSLLTKVNLKKIINMDTFEALPLDSRRHLISLLPVHDQTPPSDATAPSTNDYWIHPTALNNEFLSKALQDYSIRQMNGDFSPRLNSRTGLRKSVGNRQRYSSPVVSPVPIPHSSTPLPHPSAITKEEPNSTKLITTSSHLKASGIESPISRFRNKPSTLQTVLTKEPTQVQVESEMDEKKSQKDISTKPEKNEMANQSVFSHFVSTSASSAAATISSFSSSTSTLSSSPSPHGPSSSSPCAGLSPTASNNTNFTNLMLPTPYMSSDEMERTTKRVSVPSEPSVQRRLNMPKLESTLLLQNGVKPPPDHLLTSPRRSTISAPSRRLPQTGADFPSNSRPPLVVDSTTPVASSHTTMPPPRETKTLASVREKLRAKRLMMSQQHTCQSIPAKVLRQQRPVPPLVSIPLSDPTPPPPHPTAGSLTPNPGTSFSGDFYSCPTTSQESMPPISGPVMQSPAVLIQPTGSSVSAPATPQHGSTGGGIPGPLPAILANFKQARVVVTPSRSGSSVSSNEGGPEAADPDHPLSDVHPQPQILQPQQQQLQSLQQKQPTPPQQQPLVAVPASACSVGGGTTTTRAFFVDGNNLSETLALLQSMNPRATVTQQQFLLIPSTDKSHAILCRTPIAIQPKQTPPQPQLQITRKHSGSVPVSTTTGCSTVSTSATPTVLPLILPANRSQEHQQQQQVPAIPPGLYREILPNNSINANLCSVQRIHQPTPIQPQQQAAQLRPAQTYYSLLAPSTIATSGVNTNHTNVSGSNNNPPTSFLPPPN